MSMVRRQFRMLDMNPLTFLQQEDIEYDILVRCTLENIVHDTLGDYIEVGKHYRISDHRMPMNTAAALCLLDRG